MSSAIGKSSTSGSPDVVVIGGGVIGLAVAWRARQRGMSVTLLERGQIGNATSRVAAGMLAPVAEVEFGAAARRALALGLRSAQMWPAFAPELAAAGGVEVALMRTGTLLIARDDDEARELERRIELRESLGLATTRLRPSEARAREPALAPTVRLALEVPDDHSVDPRPVLAALRRACESAGVQLREHAPVARIETDGSGARITGVALAGGHDSGAQGASFVAAGQVVLAAGAWSGQIDGLAGSAAVPVRPVRGQILRLRDPSGPGLLRRAVRFEGVYLVPRADGRYVLGGTVEERGFDLEPAVGGVHQLLRDAREAVPGVSELEIEELGVGLRPGTPDNTPAIGRDPLEGLIWATGHYRNGILLAPLTAQLVSQLLAGEQPDAELLATCSPLRFTADAPHGRGKDVSSSKASDARADDGRLLRGAYVS